MPWREHGLVPEPEGRQRLEVVRASAEGVRPRLAYVNVPFCHARCAFCGFYKNRYAPSASAPYVDAVIEEIAREAEDVRLRARRLSAVYLGGGTPTALEARDLDRLVRAARALLPLSSECEMTLEGRVAYLDDERVDAAMGAGVNRLSLGVQSFDTEIRRRQGRRSSREELVTFLSRLLARDEAAIVIDLIYGLPGQSAEHWQEDLRIALELGVDGLDIYPLAVFPGTALFEAIREQRIPKPPSLPEMAERYRVGVETLLGAGWAQVSNTHFASRPRERNLYNLLIKAGAETFAYGSGAGGALGQLSFQNEGCLDRYLERVRAGEKPVEAVRHADHLQPARDLILGDLEQGRLDLEALLRASPAASAFGPALGTVVSQWARAGLLETDGARVRLSLAGRFWSNNLASALFGLLAGMSSSSTEAAEKM